MKVAYKYLTFLGLMFFLVSSTYSQDGKGYLEGRIFDEATNDPIPFASLVIFGTNIGSVSDLDGRFIFTGISPGYIQIAASSVGFESFITEKFLVTNANKVFIEVGLKSANVEIDEITIKASPFRQQDESPVSLQRIGIEQIEKNPGGNRDISRVIQSFPGVASTAAFRNDLIVRGGGPSENKFMLDGIEIPNLNHFATQGASGGPVGIVNVDFLREVNFYSGAFPVESGNAMSSMLDMRQIDGNKDKLKFKGSLGASDIALTVDGPLSNNTTFIASARRSYLQFLFSALGLPFLPTYNDFQFKTRTKINQKNEISFIGIGAIDQFELNTEANETPEQRYILSFIPVNEQWNYTIGTVYKHYSERGYDTWVLSRNYLNNVSYKYPNNDETKAKTYDYTSAEIENKFRYERNRNTLWDLDVNYGVNFEYAKYSNETFNQVYIIDSLINLNYNTSLDMFNYGVFYRATKQILNRRLAVTLGIRADGSSYSSTMNNPFKQLSPRVSLSYKLTQDLSLNANVGRYHQRPPYTALGFKTNSGELANKNLTYIKSDHFVAGLAYRPNQASFFSVEGFYKAYSDYPFSQIDSVPLATKGADFGTFGDEPLVPISKGRTYGFELLARSQNFLGFNSVLSYTYVRSEFIDERSKYKGNYLPTSWDNRHLLNLTATKQFKKNWYFGFKWRFVGGAPVTPFDEETSSKIEAWDVRGAPYLDYSRFNENRLEAFHQLDVRIDKQYYFNKWSINFYVDIQNVYNFQAKQQDYLVRKSFVDPDYDDVNEAEGTYELQYVKSTSGTIVPTIGIIVEF